MESDPTGRDPHQSGAKLDAGKNRVGLVLGDFANALNEVSSVGTFGAVKYTPHGWLDVPDGIERYEDAMMRHWLKLKMGETHDPDSGLHHYAHLAWNALAVLELISRAPTKEQVTAFREEKRAELNELMLAAEKEALAHLSWGVK